MDFIGTKILIIISTAALAAVVVVIVGSIVVVAIVVVVVVVVVAIVVVIGIAAAIVVGVGIGVVVGVGVVVVIIHGSIGSGSVCGRRRESRNGAFRASVRDVHCVQCMSRWHLSIGDHGKAGMTVVGDGGSGGHRW